MGIGKSLKKFVKKAAPIVGMVAPFIPGIGPIAGAAIGALGQVAGGGGVKEALLGGLGGYAAGGFGQGVQQAGGWGKLLSQPGGGIGSLLKAGWGGVKGTPLGQGIGGIFNKFTGGAQIAGGGGGGAPVGGAQQAGGWSSSYKPTQTNYLDAAADLGHGPPRGTSDFAMDAMTGKFSGSPGADTESGLVNNIVDKYNAGTQGQGTKGGLLEFAKNMFNEQNLPLTAGIGGALAQWWENKQNEGAGDVAWGEGLDYHSPVRGSQIHGEVLTTPGAANGGRIGFANGGDLYFGDEGEQSLYRDLVKVFTGEITGAEARAVMEAAQGDLGSKAIEMAKQEASYKPMANGGRIRQGGLFGGLFGGGDDEEARDPEYEGWKKMYKQNPDIGMMHNNAAEYLKRLEKEKVDTKARGGIIGLANGGEPTHEMDYRGGGFIPVGAQERADDVPARLSKNEFVMTADAVRAAGGGSIDRGSQRMYDLMNSLEARA